jgi:TorA maturation chaperone TorD
MVNDKQNGQHSLLKGYNMLLYFAGTMIIYKPSEECIVDFWKEGILKKLPVCSSNPAFLRAASQLRESCSDSLSDTASMTEDFYRLFSREELPLAPLFESFYRNIIPGSYTSKKQEVTEFYDSYGWSSVLRTEKKDDHLGVELLFLTILIEKYLVLDDEACRGEMRNEIKRFIEQHLLTWIPEWHKRVQHNSHTMSYKGISSLIMASIEDIHSILSGLNNKKASDLIFRN